MNVDKKTVQVTFISLAIALLWSMPAIRQFGGAESTSTEVIASVLIRTVIVFAVIRFVLWMLNKKKK